MEQPSYVKTRLNGRPGMFTDQAGQVPPVLPMPRSFRSSSLFGIWMFSDGA